MEALKENHSRWAPCPGPSSPPRMAWVLRRKGKESAGDVHLDIEAEHVPEAWSAPSEMQAVLQSPGGSMLFTVNLSGLQWMFQGGLFLSKLMACRTFW